MKKNIDQIRLKVISEQHGKHPKKPSIQAAVFNLQRLEWIKCHRTLYLPLGLWDRVCGNISHGPMSFMARGKRSPSLASWSDQDKTNYHSRYSVQHTSTGMGLIMKDTVVYMFNHWCAWACKAQQNGCARNKFNLVEWSLILTRANAVSDRSWRQSMWGLHM